MDNDSVFCLSFYCATALSVGKLDAGEVVCMTPKRIKNPTTINPNQKITYPFLVQPSLFSAQGILPKASTR